MQLQVDKLGKVAVTVEQDYWNIDKDYDKLTIVQKEGIFGTYISRHPVPAGTELTDRKYWIPFSSLKEDIVLDYNSFKDKYGVHISAIYEHLSVIDRDIQELFKIKNIAQNAVDTAAKAVTQANKAICNACCATNAANAAIKRANASIDHANNVLDDITNNQEQLEQQINDETKTREKNDNKLQADIEQLSQNLNSSKADLKKSITEGLSQLSNDIEAKNYINGATYGSHGEYEHAIILKHDDKVVATVDATDFILDKAVDDVKIENDNLVITFNTDAGSKVIKIPLAKIFNPNNYYTKVDVDKLHEEINKGINKLNEETTSIKDLIKENAQIVFLDGYDYGNHRDVKFYKESTDKLSTDEDCSVVYWANPEAELIEWNDSYFDEDGSIIGEQIPNITIESQLLLFDASKNTYYSNWEDKDKYEREDVVYMIFDSSLYVVFKYINGVFTKIAESADLSVILELIEDLSNVINTKVTVKEEEDSIKKLIIEDSDYTEDDSIDVYTKKQVDNKLKNFTLNGNGVKFIINKHCIPLTAQDGNLYDIGPARSNGRFVFKYNIYAEEGIYHIDLTKLHISFPTKSGNKLMSFYELSKQIYQDHSKNVLEYKSVVRCSYLPNGSSEESINIPIPEDGIIIIDDKYYKPGIVFLTISANLTIGDVGDVFISNKKYRYCKIIRLSKDSSIFEVSYDCPQGYIERDFRKPTYDEIIGFLTHYFDVENNYEDFVCKKKCIFDSNIRKNKKYNLKVYRCKTLKYSSVNSYDKEGRYKDNIHYTQKYRIGKYVNAYAKNFRSNMFAYFKIRRTYVKGKYSDWVYFKTKFKLIYKLNRYAVIMDSPIPLKKESI